ncbi:hypothetical protein F892_00774 [Acinetobacter vivianii]|uniref:Uncharacterized protein n=1 Tax=Acinetobacter vivianii TaxID=1776742 RepID=N9Q3K5_9GAMM|nr:hypothetical protein [Acinetobacter vivianii]ENX21542.1 hypothetical protein F892_00774 [Acinetobacter vivianii]GGI61355.1 hypothetical protein GCM10011446_28500 [Acinetobacter vivianii]
MNKEEFLELNQQKQEDEKYIKWSKYVYASKRRIQRRVLSLERDIAQNINQFKTYKQKDECLESSIAFLSCWKFSKLDFGKNTFWCDAVYFDQFTMKDDRTFRFSGHAWIGFTENTENQWQVPCSGVFIMNAHLSKLKSYKLCFYHEDQIISLIKMI